MTFSTALVIAASFWSGHGYTVPCHPQAVAKPNSAMPVVNVNGFMIRADMATTGCDIWLSPAARADSRDPDMEASFCAEVTHEVGHVIGLPHAPGIMDGQGIAAEDYPPRCWRHYKPRRHIMVARWDGRKFKAWTR